MEEQYKVGNIVWIKLKGYPWWPGVIKQIISDQEYLVKFFIELSECKINGSKIKSFNKYKEEFSKTKLKKLTNIIKIADLVSKGYMTFEQHMKFVKDGIKLCEEQISELEKIKKEKEKIEEKKREKLKEKERLNHIKNAKKFKAIKKMKFLGNKRNFTESRNNYNMTKELICSIDEFIFHKRDVKLFNGYDSFFNDMQSKISESKLNTNGLNAILKLVKYMNNSRNFTNDISNKLSFISLKNEINKKIKETLFDEKSLFLSSSFNFFCSNYNSQELTEEGKNISNLLDNISTLNEEEILENNSIVSNGQNKALLGSTESKKRCSESEDEKSSSFGSKLTKFSQIEEKKQKINICLLKYSDLLNLLDINNNNNNDNINNNKINDSNVNYNNDELQINKDKIKSKINQIENEIKNNSNIDIKNSYLRKMVCLKLYKALKFALKNLNLEENEIKNICLYIEAQGRIIDNSMTNKYKEFIENVFKKISNEKYCQIKKNS